MSKEDHAVDILQKLNEDRKGKGKHCDFTIVVDNRKFHVHKCVVSVLSEFFDQLTAEENGTVVFNHEDISSEAVESILEFVYTYKVHITADNVFKLLATAHCLKLSSILKLCDDFLQKDVNLNNSLSLLCVAKSFELNGVSNKVKSFISENFSKISRKESLTNLRPDDFSDVMNLDGSKQLSEEHLCRVILKWAKEDKTERWETFLKLFSKIDHGSLSREYLQSILDEKLVMDSPECTGTLLKATLQHVPFASTHFVVLGGRGSDNAMRKYDGVKKSWVCSPDFSSSFAINREGATAVRFKRNLYLMGGETNAVEVLNLDDRTGTWIEIVPMKQRRQFAGSAAMDGLIYVIGGWDGHEYLSSGEVYHPPLQKWHTVPSMHHPRSEHGVASHDGLIYAVGGALTDTVECFDPDSKVWTIIAPMNSIRSGLGVVVFEGEIYAIGGHSGNDYLLSVEKFSPKSKTWSEAPSLVNARYGLCACVSGGKIYAIGGKNYSTNIETVEVFDSKKSVWTNECSIDEGKLYSSAVAL